MVYFNDQLKNTSYADKWRCELPTTPNLIRKFYKQGKYAIHNNLPHPSVNSVHGHSYVSLKEIIQDSLANDNKFEPIYNPLQRMQLLVSTNLPFVKISIENSHLIMIQ